MTYWITPDPVLPRDATYSAVSEYEKMQSLTQRVSAHFGLPKNYTRRLMNFKIKTGSLQVMELPDAKYNSLIAGNTFTVDASTDIVTMAAFTMRGGFPFTVSSSGTLPAGLSAATTYYAGAVSGNTFKIYPTAVDARDGTNVVNMTDAGTGTHKLCVLSATELSTATNSSPGGLTASSNLPVYEVQPFVSKQILCFGDSITNCQVVAHADNERLHALLLDAADSKGQATRYDDEWAYNRDRAALNLGVDSARFIYTGTPARADQNWKEAYHWAGGHFRIPASQMLIIVVFLGSNDLTHEGITGAQCWTRATELLTRIRADYPTAKIVMCTSIARGSMTTIRDYNQLIRANWASYADGLADLGALPEFDDSNPAVVTANATYYAADGVHPKPAGTAKAGPCIKAVIDAF